MLTGARFGTRDIKRAIAFYDKVAATLGASRVIDRHGMAGYRGPEGGIFIVGTPREGEACVGNGSQVMWAAPSRAAVDAAHAMALAEGGACEGPPGPRGAPENNMYAAYFRDPDGNKVMVTRIGDSSIQSSPSLSRGGGRREAADGGAVTLAAPAAPHPLHHPGSSPGRSPSPSKLGEDLVSHSTP